MVTSSTSPTTRVLDGDSSDTSTACCCAQIKADAPLVKASVSKANTDAAIKATDKLRRFLVNATTIFRVWSDGPFRGVKRPLTSMLDRACLQRKPYSVPNLWQLVNFYGRDRQWKRIAQASPASRRAHKMRRDISEKLPDTVECTLKCAFCVAWQFVDESSAWSPWGPSLPWKLTHEGRRKDRWH